MTPKRQPDITLNAYLAKDGFVVDIIAMGEIHTVSREIRGVHPYQRLNGRLLGCLLAALNEFEKDMNAYGDKNGSV